MCADGLHDLLVGYVDPQQKAIAINAIGETGLNVRLYNIFYLQAFVMNLYRAQHHRLIQYFQDSYFLAYDMAMTSWYVETLRLMDRAKSSVGGGYRENMTVPLFHERFQASLLIAGGEKTIERELYEELNAHYEANGFRDFRNRHMFHLDLSENMKKATPSGNLHEVANRLHRWYKHAAGVVIGGVPRFITETSVATGIEQAKTLKHLMIDALRYQLSRDGPHKARDYTRYGWRSGLWIDDLESRRNAEP